MMQATIGFDLDLVFGALADSHRRLLIEELRSGKKTVGSLQKPLGVSTWGVIKHLRVLEKSGLVRTEKRGRCRYCELQVEPLQTATQWMGEVRTFWSGNLDRLVEHLDDPI